jgi:hypothetical protein
MSQYSHKEHRQQIFHEIGEPVDIPTVTFHNTPTLITFINFLLSAKQIESTFVESAEQITFCMTSE